MNAFKFFIVREVVFEIVHMQRLFDEPVITEELILWGTVAIPQLLDMLEVSSEHIEHSTWVWGGFFVVFAKRFAEHMQTRVMLVFQP